MVKGHLNTGIVVFLIFLLKSQSFFVCLCVIVVIGSISFQSMAGQT